jgi:hypothetical protein
MWAILNNPYTALTPLHISNAHYRQKNKQKVITDFTPRYVYLPLKEYHNRSYSLDIEIPKISKYFIKFINVCDWIFYELIF